MSAENRPYLPATVNVRLECGCAVQVRAIPVGPRVRYACPSNQGHGYRVRWVSWREGTREGRNPETSSD
jgi:hypothetical protein